MERSPYTHLDILKTPSRSPVRGRTLAVNNTAGESSNLDIDQNGIVDALTDGILIIRYLFGIAGDALTENAIGDSAIRDATDIVAHLDGLRDSLLDVDGNGLADALTDGILIIRYLFGIRDDALVDGAIGPNATRTTGEAIASFLEQSESSGFNIELDYRFDSTGFFDDPDRRAALAAVAQIWESFIQDDFTNVPAEISFAVENPTTEETEMLVLDAEIDDLLIFVGARSLPGNTLAQAGPDGVNAAGSIFSNRLEGSNFEPWVGSITFDTDANWFFDPTPDTDDDIPFGQSDFITTALHEIGHILGIGTADIFREIAAGAAFDGFNALAVNGGDPIPLESDLFHVQEGFENNTVLMDPTSTTGTRKLPTQVDLALLADIGYEISGFTTQGETPPIATPGDDVTIFGSIIADTIDGLAGNDQIQGDRGDDLLNGGEGNDLIFGEEGNDTLNGGLGDDILIGGEGIDTFFFAANNGADSINDFNSAEDAIALAGELGFTTGEEAIEAITTQGNIIGGGRFAVVTLSPGNQIKIFANTDLTAANFIIV
ncbi:MAG: hypothetical protein AB4352_05385 [Hormoscilla sp.]